VHRVLGIVLVALLLAAGTVLPVSADPTSWRAEFYNNVNLAGAPVLVRDDSMINFDWGAGSPGSGVDSDRFSVRWTTYAYYDGGDYIFNVTVDDGVRLWVNSQLLIDRWYDQPATTYSAGIYLAAGYHNLRVEYYENSGQALCKVWWSRSAPAEPVTGWRAEYYNNTWLGGSPALVRSDAAVNFDWGYSAPAPGIGADNFSVRWTRDVYFDTSTNYTFYATVDDGVRVWVRGTLVIDKWYAQSRTTHSGTLYLPVGTHQVRIEYFEQTGVALCQVSWTGAGVAPAPGPVSPYEIIVDDRDPGFVWGGPRSSFYSRATGFRGNLYWTWNSQTTMYHWGKWIPNIPTAGNWEAYVYIASRYHGTKSAKYVIYHGAGQNSVVVNQNIYNNQWVSLGTYYFAAGSSGYVFLGDNTGEAYATRFVGFDAVKFVRRDGAVPPPPPPPAPPSGCAITPVLGFGNVWNTYGHVRSKLGCPTEPEKGVWAAEQTFQGGYMFWRQDENYIYVLFNDGTWKGYTDTWTSVEPEWDTMIFPPSGYYQPKRGFGKVWRTDQSVRNGLAWATMEERGFWGTTQPFQGGRMLWSSARGIFVLYNDGRWERF